MSVAILKHELSSEDKVVDCPRTNKTGVHTGTRCPHAVPQRKASTLYSGIGIVPEFWRGYLRKGGVHISARQVQYSGTVPGHQV